MGSDWCPQCSLCGSTFVEECSQVGEGFHQVTGESLEMRPLLCLDEWGREFTSMPLWEGLPIAPSIGSSLYVRPNTAHHSIGMQTSSLSYYTAGRTASTSTVTENSSPWQHVLERLWDAFSRLRSSRREQTTVRPPMSAHTTATTSTTNHSTLYSSSVSSGSLHSLPTSRVSRRVRRRTGEHTQDMNSLNVEEIWEQEYARVEAFLSSMLDCLLELYSQRSSPTSKSFVDSLEGQLLTEQDAKEAESCAICWEEFQVNTVVVFLPCSHLFCKNCICTWLKENSTCPTCRYKLPVDNAKSNHEESI
ncbi:E3 ubiquitin-protein ligase RING1 [Galdieria sulphuraria]|nr:E3 ubiquitin-protein ligase RING1 [Galdieria sulphuraria]